MGADKGVLVTDPRTWRADTWATSQTLAGAIRHLEYDLIINGTSGAIDRRYRSGWTSDFPSIWEIRLFSYAQKIEIEGDSVIVDVSLTRISCVKGKNALPITALAELNEPR